uniref:Uncharacterized protein n=1 Tax=Rhizophora mucronata TaxID=61149 RepID=A0A2P2MPV6_RHIMU
MCLGGRPFLIPLQNRFHRLADVLFFSLHKLFLLMH